VYSFNYHSANQNKEQNLDTRGIAGSDAAWTTMTTGVNTAMNDLKTIGEKAQGDLAGNRALLAHALNVMNAIVSI
jgi:hypothetical protein